MVDTTAPTVSSVAITSSTSNTDESQYKLPPSASTGIAIGSLCDGSVAGSECYIYVTATFSENVTVTGSPRLTIVVASTPRTAFYNTAASGSTAVVFRYAILSDDEDDGDGISIGANALALNSGTIKDLAGNDATIIHGAVGANSSYKVKEF
jgi:hypothetical protein